MKNYLLASLAFLCLILSVSAKDGEGSQLFQNVQRNFARTAPQSFSLFKPSNRVYVPGSVKGIENATFLTIDQNPFYQLFTTQPETVTLQVPAPDGSGTWKLDLYRSQILSSDFEVKTSDGKTFSAPEAIYYQGIFNNDPQSMAVVSVFENQLMGMLSNSQGNYDLGVYGEDQLSEYVFYRSNEVGRQLPFDCHTSDVDEPVGTAAVAGDCRIVRVYIECDFDLYTKRTSVANVTTFVTGFFNQVAAIYTNESIQVQISQIYVWTSTDPFISQTTSNGVLSAFRTTRTTFNGNIAHLISTRSTNMGGVAYLDVLCATTYRHAFSNIYNSYGSFPTYSWTVNCFSHEMGHNFGSNHTQWCGWTGGALDNCYTTEGGCAAGPAPVNGGTIMSYCHVTGYGVNLANGFGTQPGNKLRTKYLASTCLTGGVAISIVPAGATICSGSNITLTASGATSYTWMPTTGLNVPNTASVIATPSATSTYTATSVVNNCTVTASSIVTVLASVNRGTLASGNQTFTTSGDPAAISFSTSATGGSGTFAYQWYSKAGIQTAPTGTATTGWTAISGATSASYDPGVQTASISYAVTVDATGSVDCGGAAWASGVRQITVNASTGFSAGTLTSSNQTFCSTGGDPASINFTITPSGATSYSYQWYYKNGIATAPTGTSTTGWTIINGATASTYDPAAGLTQSRTYACRVTPSTGTATWASGARQITVLPAFNPGTIASGDQSFCATGNPGAINMSVNPVGSGAYTWRWYYKESTSIACPTGNSITGWLTNTTSANISGTTLTGAGVTFDPISAGAINNGRTFAVLITPIANGSVPACGTAAWASNCRKTYVTTCTGAMPGEELVEGNMLDLGQSFPNPTNSHSTIQYSLPDSYNGARLVFYDQLGRIMSEQIVPTGIANEYEFKGDFLPSGTYYYSLEFAGTKLATKKLVLIH